MHQPSPLLRKWKRYLGDVFLCLLAAILIVWLGDWAVWHLRVWHGGGYDTVQVTQLLLTPLKNHRVKADEQSTADQPCARSIFPHGGDDPCWWLRRHATEVQNASLVTPQQPLTAMPRAPDSRHPGARSR
jgi:hypothetical protein